MNNIKVALIGTPNVGKSTIYNALTKNNEHTGNWAGKTVNYTKGDCSYENTLYTIYDLPGTYSLISKSKEEIVATDFICFEPFDVAVVVCDATSLYKGINLVIQTKEICKKVVVCVNLIDEALKKGIDIDYELLSKNLDCLVVKTSARDNIGLNNLLNAIKLVEESDYLDLNYKFLNKDAYNIANNINLDSINNKWVMLRYLENNLHYIDKYNNFGVNITKDIDILQKKLKNIDISLEIVTTINDKVNIILKDVINYKDKKCNNKKLLFDKILTSKLFGIPIMLLMLFIIFYLTIIGANYPSSLLFNFFSSFESNLINILEFIHLPKFIIDLLVNGVYKTLYWVISVMMPPMLIFFPLFSYLEDLGVLPRIAFNMDKAFMKCKACGKQALTMCMGLGCNAVGVTGARIIDSKRERLIAILTNAFMPCNGKFPTIIAITTIFLVGLNTKYGSLYSSLILTGFIGLGILLTFIISYILSKTILKGMNTSFILELPPYRKPKILNTIWYSLKNKAIYVLIRAIKVAIPAGVVIWGIANIKINNVLLLEYLTNFLEPFGEFFGLDGVIILALLLGFPANEIVIPAMLMCYLKTNALIDFNNLIELKNILILNGWTLKTALCFLIIMCFHYPCSTTLLTIKKETNSLFYALLSFIIPTLTGLVIALIINIIF
ncbi:MAG: ferrous iron transport protein B [Firmicutes bacterium]|nr:ferrous iron transport protein B [Bacillota bacterium]